MRRLLTQLSIWLLPLFAFGVERFPPPEFTTNYQQPVTTTPGPRAEWLGHLDGAVLLAALALAAFFVYKKRSRPAIFGLMIASIAYFGFFRRGCVCPVGAIQNVAMSIWQSGYGLPVIVAAFFILPLVFALFAGRVFCAGVCPLGAAQDVVLVKPVKVPAWLEYPLGLLPYIYLGFAVLFAATGSLFAICKYDPFVSFYRLSGPAWLIILSGAMLALSTVVGRPYCRFLCPYSALLRLLSPLAKWRVTITPDKCVQCRLCEDACPFGAIRFPTPEEPSARRFEGKGRLAILLALLPVLIVGGGLLGGGNSAVLARVNPKVRLAERIWAEEHGAVKGTTLESKSFRDLALTNRTLYKEATAIRRQFTIGGWALGGWIGLVIGVSLIRLSIRRKRSDYEPDVSACLACGRCYQFCPIELERRGVAVPEYTSEPSPPTPAGDE